MYNTVKFIQTIRDVHFGEIDIYQHNDGQYIMKSTSTHIVPHKETSDFRKIV